MGHIITKMSRFRKVKTAEEQKKNLEDAVPSSTKYSNKWACKIFADWQTQRQNHDPKNEVFTYEVKEVSAIQDLSRQIDEFNAESMDFLAS